MKPQQTERDAPCKWNWSFAAGPHGQYAFAISTAKAMRTQITHLYWEHAPISLLQGWCSNVTSPTKLHRHHNNVQ